MLTLRDDNLNTFRPLGRIRVNIYFNLFLTIFLATIEITPYLSRNFSHTINFIIFIIWILSAILINGLKSKFSLKSRVVIWSLIWISLQLVMRALGKSNLVWNYFIDQITVFFIPIMMILILKTYNRREKIFLATFLFVIVSINIIHNVIIGISEPSIFWYLNDVVFGAQARLTNAGSTEFVSVCMFFVPLCMMLLLNVKSVLLYVLNIVIIGFSLWFLLFVNQRATAFFLLLLMFFGVIFVSLLRNNKAEKIAITYVVFGSFFLLMLFLIPVLKWASSLFSSERMISRINSLIVFLEGTPSFSKGDSSLFLRIELAQTSISTFFNNFSNFFFGIGERIHGDSIEELVQSGVGSHSEFLDCLAEYGLMGGVVIFGFISEIFKKIYSLCSSNIIRRQVKVILSGFLIYSFLNNSFSASTFYVLFLLLPLIIDLLYAKKTFLTPREN